MAKRALGPATLAITQALRTHGDPDRPWLIGCSGGRDSLALAVAARRIHPTASALVVDHGLQPGSDEVARRVRRWLTSAGVPVRVERVEVGSDGGPEAAARDARYAILRAVAAELGAEVLLAHTLDDQAETVLLGLARGSGPGAVRGMAVRSDLAGTVGTEPAVPLVRPLLGLRRTVTGQACRELGLRWWDDPHNADPRFARSRVRTQVMPVLEEQLGPGIAEALARTADLVADDADLLDDLAATAIDADSPELACTELADLPAALRRRVLVSWLRARGARDLQQAHVMAVEALVVRWRGQGPAHLPGIGVERVGARLRVRQPGPQSDR